MLFNMSDLYPAKANVVHASVKEVLYIWDRGTARSLRFLCTINSQDIESVTKKNYMHSFTYAKGSNDHG
jgi:hypothetical protein